jgi:Phytanoyl-CoA dioxygenase (PhyH)
LPDDLCEKLLEFATTRPCVQLNKDGQTSGEVGLPRFPRENPEAVRYDLPEQLSIEEPLIQGLMADRSIISVAQNYLECRPILDIVAMWWNAASAQPDKVAAQYWHFDMDRIKWLKFFVYLTDVGPDNGPHSFVAGSHRTGGIASALLQKGYARLTDEEVTGEYSADKFVEFTAPRGTVIAEDTRGLHKGKHVIEGDRLMLQLQFSNSLFGGEYPKRKIGRVDNPALAEMISAYPRLYSNYV